MDYVNIYIRLQDADRFDNYIGVPYRLFETGNFNIKFGFIKEAHQFYETEGTIYIRRKIC